MNKIEFLSQNKCVIGFVDYLVGCIDGSVQVNHQYKIVWPIWRKYHRQNFVNNAEDVWRVRTLKEAFDTYFWPPGNYSENVCALPNFNESVQHNKEARELSLFHSSIETLSWGNVVSKGSVNWLLSVKEELGLEGTFNNIVSLLIEGTEKGVIEAFNTPKKFLMNSGTTKIFSFYSNVKAEENGGCVSIIYDGRVGAALGVLVKNFLINNCYDEVPPPLAFMWGADQSNTGKRNPSTEKYIFSELKSGTRNNSGLHALMNLRANWVLDAAISKCGPQVFKYWGVDEVDNRGELMRRVEAALFMIGADVSG